MKIGILSSSRADFGIYLPLLKYLNIDDYFDLEIIAFGSHLSINHGFTLTEILDEGFEKIHRVSSLISNDDEHSIASSYGLTALKFADFWASNTFDLVLCLGDRFEMNAAVQAGIPYGVKFAHLHGGETTSGAIDNIYRHQISLSSDLHFVSHEAYAEKVALIRDSNMGVYTVGSLSLVDLSKFKPIPKLIFYDKFKIPISDYALVTFHPETINSERNHIYATEMRKALTKIASEMTLVITMPNADTLGSVYRKNYQKLFSDFPVKVICVENFGKENYFNAMYYSKLLIGNTSSGIIEAASFGKYVVNVGDRQKGRIQSLNCINTNFEENEIVSGVKTALLLGTFKGENVYYKPNVVENIVEKLKLL